MAYPVEGIDTMKRTCSVADCTKTHQARGLCSSHYAAWHRGEKGSPHHVYVDRTCEICGTVWQTPRPEARFCTAKCKGVYLSERNRKSCPIPDGHPVRQLMKVAAAAEREARKAKAAAKARPFAWRTARECPGCGCWFTPLRTPNTICCSARCARKMSKRRRRAREHNTLNTWRWSDFMRIARRFGYCCAYCGERDGQLEPDHVVPLSRGGDDSISNLLPACRLCNADKNAKTLDEWSAWRAERGKPPRATAWAVGDARYAHLTSVLPAAA